MFAERQKLLLQWLPNAESLDPPGLTHLLHAQDPAAAADGLTGFFTRHPISEPLRLAARLAKSGRTSCYVPRRLSRARVRCCSPVAVDLFPVSQGKDDSMPRRSAPMGASERMPQYLRIGTLTVHRAA